jgi:hypothetical protein
MAALATITKAEFLIPGSLFPESTCITLDTLDPDAIAKRAPRGAFCFTTYEITEAPDLGPEYTVTSRPRNRSGRFYLGGELHDIDQVRALGLDTLVANMRANGWATVIKCRTGNWQPFEPGDQLLEVA